MFPVPLAVVNPQAGSATDLAYYNAGSGRWTVAPGRYTALIGTSSTELDHAASFDVGRLGHGR